MRYELDRLGPDNFEHMIQSLIRGLAGISTIVFGDGPDGQREASIENANFHIAGTKTVYGRTIAQAKFKSPDGKDKDWDWLRKNLKQELDGLKTKTKTHPHIIPETYLFFTNIVLTPVLDKGIRDKSDKLISEYRDIIPNIIILGADDIRTLLENNREVARSYSSFIMSGDVLSELYDQLELLKNEKFEVLIEYARQMFREDCAVRLEQAGSVSNKSINIRNVYTDLEAFSHEGVERYVSQFAAYIIERGNQQHYRTEAEMASVKAPSRYQHDYPAKEHNIVLLGNAGQGKSTLCQYICQTYRAALLRRYAPDEIGAEGFFNNENGGELPAPRCERFPILISLKNYASWIEMQPEDSSRSVITYILSRIEGKTNASITVKQFRSLLSGYSWLFLFDGLDEVPGSSNRGEVLRQIQLFLEKDQISAHCDSLVICTSRPQGYDDAFDSRFFSHYVLCDMSEALCKSYINKLLVNIENNSDYRSQYQNILFNALNDPMVSKLMTTPLHTAIVVLLVIMGGTPPKRRYDLFYEYCDVIIRRELQKQMLPQINDEYEWIKDLHGEIGFLLQTESEQSINAAAELPSSRCKEIIMKYLNDEELEGDLKATTEDIYYAITKRLSFLSEIIDSSKSESVVFPLRSIQEYYAAEWLITFGDENALTRALEMISVSAYWRNVFLFVAGYITKHKEKRNLNSFLLQICLRNCGDDNQVDPDTTEATELKISTPGSKLALDLLCDNLFSLPTVQKRYLRIAAIRLDWKKYKKQISYEFMQLPDKLVDSFIQEYVIPKVEKERTVDSVAFYYLWRQANGGRYSAIQALSCFAQILESPSYSSIQSLLSLGINGLPDVMICKMVHWITVDHSSEFCSHYWGDDKYWDIMEAFFQGHVDNGLSLSILRQMVYRLLMGEMKTMDRDSYARLVFLQKSPVLKELFGDAELNQPFTIDAIGDAGIRFNSLFRNIHGCSLNEHTDLFQQNELYELVALSEFLKTPSSKTLNALLKEYDCLPIGSKDAFCRIAMSCNWVLEEVFRNQYRGSNDKASEKDYDRAFFEECEKKDFEVQKLVAEHDWKTITRNRYWGLLACPYNIIISKESIIEVLQIVDHKTLTHGFISFLSAASKSWEVLPDEVVDLCLPFLSELIASGNGTELALRVFGTAPLNKMLLQTSFPSSRPNAWYFSNSGNDSSKQLLERIHMISSFGRGYMQVYALVPSILSRIDCSSVQDLPLIRPLEHFEQVKATENELAVFGFVLRVLFDPISAELQEAIKDSLSKFLALDEYELYFEILAGNFSKDAKLLIYGLLSRGLEKESLFELLGTYEDAILRGLESSPLEKEEWSELARHAHKYIK